MLLIKPVVIEFTYCIMSETDQLDNDLGKGVNQ